MTDQQVAAKPGWYAQPDGHQRYWDGRKYTATWGETGAVADVPTRSDIRAATPQPVPTSGGIFAGLLDFGFTTFITLKILRVIYVVAVVAVVLAAVIAFVMVFSRGGWYIPLAFVGVPLAALIYLVLVRVSMEMTALFFRIGENTSLMLAKL